MSKTDIQIKEDVEAELLWDPNVNAAQIGVGVNKGAVSLLGTVDTYAEKWAAEDATKRVSGVRAVAQELTVKLLGPHQRTDSEIATAVQHALQWDILIPRGVTAKVHEGRVTLEGHVTWHFQRESAERALRNIKGVVAIYDSTTLKPQTSVGEVRERIRHALRRQAANDASSIHVDASGGKVTLTGHASSWENLQDAKKAAWYAEGVTDVVDEVELATF